MAVVDRIDGRGLDAPAPSRCGSPPAGTFSVWPILQHAVLHAVGLLQRDDADAGLAGDRRQRVARLRPCRCRRAFAFGAAGLALPDSMYGSLAASAGGLRLAVLQLRLLRQDGDLFRRRTGRQLVLARPSTAWHRRRLRLAALARIGIGRDDDLLAGLEPVGLAQAVDLHDDVGRHVEAARQAGDGLAVPGRRSRSPAPAWRRPWSSARRAAAGLNGFADGVDGAGRSVECGAGGAANADAGAVGLAGDRRQRPATKPGRGWCGDRLRRAGRRPVPPICASPG